MAQVAVAAEKGAVIGFSTFGPVGGVVGATIGVAVALGGTITIAKYIENFKLAKQKAS